MYFYRIHQKYNFVSDTLFFFMYVFLPNGSENLITEKKIKEKVIDEWCSCGVCKTGDYSNIKTDKCKLSIREITRTCNTLGIPTTTGLVGKWERIQVRRILFGK